MNAWVRWPAIYVGALLGSAGLGRVTPLGPGNAVFLAGAGFILASLGYVRLGGPKAIVGRTMRGVPILGLDAKKRSDEIRRGLAVLAIGLGLWAALGVGIWLGR